MIDRYFAVAIALLRAREAGDDITDHYVLAECEAWDVDPGPVMVLVQGKGPRLRYGYYQQDNGRKLFVSYRGDTYESISNPRLIYTGTRELAEAVQFRIAADKAQCDRGQHRTH